LRLRGVVRGPILCVGLARDLDCLGCDGLTVWALLALDCIFNRVDVLASGASKFVIPASAIKEVRIDVNLIFAVARL